MQKTIDYFQSHEGYFWQWAEDGEVIEWADGTTICYRDELMVILRDLEDKGLPCLGSILLVLSVCKSKLRHDVFINSFEDLTASKKWDDFQKRLANRLVGFDMVMKEMDNQFRKGRTRSFLFQVLFSHTSHRLNKEDSKLVLDNFERQDGTFFMNISIPLTAQRVEKDIDCLFNAIRLYSDAGKLRNVLARGVALIPRPLNIELEENPKAKALPIANLLQSLKENASKQLEKSLLDQLLDDPKTQGIARLTKRLIAALNIPMHTSGVSDQRFGGISDITNRGEYDKLLLTELANDDLTMTARLVNNEALYFNHEAPPPKTNKQRLILVDSTLKMWGLPRAFSISAALACTFQRQEQVPTTTISLGKKENKTIDLTTKKGVGASLEILDIGLDCSEGLKRVLIDKKTDNADTFFITNEAFLKSAIYQKNLMEWQQAFDYLLTVSRLGELRFYHLVNGRRKLVNNAAFDLEALLLGKLRRKSKVEVIQKKQASGMEPVPYFYPEIGNRFARHPHRYLDCGKLGIIGVNHINRLLYFPSASTGGIEILPNVGEGKFCFGYHLAKRAIYVAVFGKRVKGLKIYTFDIDKEALTIQDFSTDERVFYKAIFRNHTFFFENHHAHKIYSKCFIYDGEIRPSDVDEWNQAMWTTVDHKRPRHKVSPFINSGYWILTDPTIFINSQNKIQFAGHIHLNLEAYRGERLYLSRVGKKYPNFKKQLPSRGNPFSTRHPENRHIHFKTFEWRNGSTTTFDERGILKLKSKNTTLPEISIILVHGRQTAAFADNGLCCGSDYFINPKSGYQKIDDAEFYDKCIKPFIMNLL